MVRETGSDEISSTDLNLEQTANAQGFLLPPELAPGNPELPCSDSFVFPDVADYQIQNRIGSGGTSVVYVATREGSTDKLAIKVFAGTVLDRNNLIRFGREVESLKKLQHPNIVKLCDFGVAENGSPFLVFDYVDACPIDEYCEKRELTYQEIAQLMVAVCEAVAFANQLGIIHRDLKPSNILVNSNGHPFVIDFGLAKLIGNEPPLESKPIDETQTGAVLGTLNYLAPEKIFGLNDQPEAATDVFGIGAILYKILTGRPPFAFEHIVDAATSYFQKLPSRMHDAKNDVPAGLSRICLTCLAADPGDRYESTEAVAQQLNRFIQNRPVTAPTKRFSSWIIQKLRKHRWLGTTLTVLMSILICSALFLLVQWQSTSQSLSDSEALAKGLRNAMFDFSDQVREQEDDPATIENRRQQLRLLSHHFQQLMPHMGADIDFLMEAAVTEFKLGTAEHFNGSRELAYKHFTRSLSGFEAILKLAPENEKARFGKFHSLFSLGDQQNRAWDAIQNLVEDFPTNLSYQEAATSVAIQLASKKLSIGRVDGVEALLAELEELTTLREGAFPPSQVYRHLARLKFLQACLAINQGNIEEAEKFLEMAANYQLRVEPLESQNDSEAREYLDIVRLRFAVAAVRQNPTLAKEHFKTAVEYYSRADSAFVTPTEIQWAYFLILRDAATYFDDENDLISRSNTISRWMQLLDNWKGETKNGEEFNVAALSLYGDPRLGCFDGQKSHESIRCVGSERYPALMAASLVYLGEKNTAKQLKDAVERRTSPRVLADVYIALVDEKPIQLTQDELNSILSSNWGYYEISNAIRTSGIVPKKHK